MVPREVRLFLLLCVKWMALFAADREAHGEDEAELRLLDGADAT